MTKAEARVIRAANLCMNSKGWCYQVKASKRFPECAWVNTGHLRSLEHAVAALLAERKKARKK